MRLRNDAGKQPPWEQRPSACSQSSRPRCVGLCFQDAPLAAASPALQATLCCHSLAATLKPLWHCCLVPSHRTDQSVAFGVLLELKTDAEAARATPAASTHGQRVAEASAGLLACASASAAPDARTLNLQGCPMASPLALRVVQMPDVAEEHLAVAVVCSKVQQVLDMECVEASASLPIPRRSREHQERLKTHRRRRDRKPRRNLPPVLCKAPGLRHGHGVFPGIRCPACGLHHRSPCHDQPQRIRRSLCSCGRDRRHSALPDSSQRWPPAR